jgi:ketopantoate reductase
MSLLPTAQTHASSSHSPSVLIVGAGRLGTWLAVKFALRERAMMMMKKKATTTKRSEDDHETMTMTPRVVLKGSGRKSKEGQKTAMKRIVEKIVEEHDIAYVESYEDERLLRTVLVGEEEGGSETASTSSMLEFDYVFVTVKTYAFDAVVEEMNRAKIPVRPKVAVMLHNGIVEPIFKGLGDGYVPCVIPQSYDFVDASEDGKVGERYVIKVKNEEKPWAMPNTREAKRVHALLTTIGANSQPDENFEYTLLRKYFINCVANLLSIVGDCNCDGLLDTKELRNRMDVLYHEMYAALEPSHGEGFAKMPEDFYDVVFSGLRTYGAHFPSTKLDFDAGALLEIDSLNGYVCARGRENGCPCLEHEKLIEEVKRLVRERDEEKKKKKNEETTTSNM